MKAVEIGNSGESKAVGYLVSQGFTIIERNWKTRYCEIDIVAKKNQRVYFVEVKTRKTSRFGSGLDYVTPRKVRQMGFSAVLWVQMNRWAGEYQLSALAIDDDLITWLEDI